MFSDTPDLPGALCADKDPELWFPINEAKQGAEAKAICRRCPAVEGCLAWALEVGVACGIWGGLDTDQRDKLRTKRPVTPKSAPVVRRRGQCPVCLNRHGLRNDGTIGDHSVRGNTCEGVGRIGSEVKAVAGAGSAR